MVSLLKYREEGNGRPPLLEFQRNKIEVGLQQQKTVNDVNEVIRHTDDFASGSGKNNDPKVVIKWNRSTKVKELKIGTWNARTMLRRGKLENVKHEMKRNGLNILGLSEVRWIDNGDFMSDDTRVIYAGGQNH